MRVSVLQENFLKGLSIVSRFVSSKSQLPVLNNILISTEEGGLKLSATNLEAGINYWIGAKIEKKGTVCIPAKTLTEFVNFLPPEKIDLEEKENTLILKCGSYSASFVGLPPSEFPAIPQVEEKSFFSLSYEDLEKIISQLVFAAAQDESRPVLTGVLFQTKETDLVIVSTDGYRLSLKKIEKPKGLDKFKEVKQSLIIPAKTLLEVGRILGEEEKKEIEMSLISSSSQVAFSSSSAQIISRLIEGDFPDFEKIIPSGGTTKVKIEKEEFLRAVRSAAVFARESANIVRLKIEGSELKISANAPQVGENLVKIDIEKEGDDCSIAFNSRYLLDFLNSVDSEKVSLEFTGALNPGVFSPDNDNSYLHLIMPVRVQE